MFRKTTVLWLGLPLAWAVACSTNPEARTATADQNAFSALPSNSNQFQPAIGSSNGTDSAAYAAPRGAGEADWKIAEEIRSTLLQNPMLGRTRFEAVVNKGTVTLKGYARTQGERKQLTETIAQLPGVQRVDDQLQIGNRVAVGGSNLTE